MASCMHEERRSVARNGVTERVAQCSHTKTYGLWCNAAFDPRTVPSPNSPHSACRIGHFYTVSNCQTHFKLFVHVQHFVASSRIIASVTRVLQRPNTILMLLWPVLPEMQLSGVFFFKSVLTYMSVPAVMSTQDFRCRSSDVGHGGGGACI